MSMWGVLHSYDDGCKHIVPVDREGQVLNWHTCDGLSCWCKPVIDDQCTAVIIHNDPERGGYNA